MDGDGIRVSRTPAYYLAHLISALDGIRAREESLAPTSPSSSSSETKAGWDARFATADILPFPSPHVAGWVVPMSA